MRAIADCGRVIKGPQLSYTVNLHHFSIMYRRNSSVTVRKNNAEKRAVAPGDPRALSNLEVVALAVYMLGGESHYVHSEDVAVKANELTPGRFTWAKYPDQINIHTILTYLWDAKSSRKGSILIGSEKEGWMLSESGLELVRSRKDALEGVKKAPRKLTAGEQQWKRGEQTRMRNTEAFRKATEEGTEAVTREEAEAFFRLNDYVVGEMRERKITRAVNVFGEDPAFGPIVKILAAKVRSR